jgi:hypothetical protein
MSLLSLLKSYYPSIPHCSQAYTANRAWKLLNTVAQVSAKWMIITCVVENEQNDKTSYIAMKTPGLRLTVPKLFDGLL